MLRRSTATFCATTSQKRIDLVKNHCYKTWTKQSAWNPIEIVSAKDCCYVDSTGRSYLDMSSGLVCATLGYNNEAVNASLAKQASELSYMSPNFTTKVRAEAVEALLPVVPKGIDKFFFPTSGTCANEGAIKIARMVTGKYKIMARYNSYHGATMSSLACTSEFRRYFAEKSLHMNTDGMIYIPEYNPYRPGPLGTTADKHIEYIDYVLENEPNTAAIILEPIVGSNGILIPPSDYWPKLREVTKKHGVLLISDEVMAAWGRAGEWFAVNKWNVCPDIITTAKGISNSVAPLGMVGTTRAIAEHFDNNIFCHGHTYESHPITLATAVAAIGEYHRLDLINRARVEGAKFGAKLATLKEKHPSVGDVRGTGFFWAVECVKNRETKEPFADNKTKARGEATVMDKMNAALFQKHGIATFVHHSHFMMAPPLIITEAEMDQAVAALDDVLSMADAEVTA